MYLIIKVTRSDLCRCKTSNHFNKAPTSNCFAIENPLSPKQGIRSNMSKDGNYPSSYVTISNKAIAM